MHPGRFTKNGNPAPEQRLTVEPMEVDKSLQSRIKIYL